MDKYEYQVTVDQMKQLADQGSYTEAARVADTVSWKKVRNSNALCQAAQVYEKVGQYETCRDLLLQAYDYAPVGRAIVSRLAEAAISAKRLDEAREYYNEFLEIAPKDNQRYVLAYEISCLAEAPVGDRIAILEEFREREYSEVWAYELAVLYSQAGMKGKCVEACDELILWFGDGAYVQRALDLKRRFQPLTPAQEEKYQKLCSEKGTVAISIPSRSAAVPAEDELPEISVTVSKFNTQNLQEELAKSMRQIMEATKKETVKDTMASLKRIVGDIPYLNAEEDEVLTSPGEQINAQVDEDLRVDFREFLQEEDGQMSFPIPGASRRGTSAQEQSIENVLSEWEKTKRAAERAIAAAESRKLEMTKEQALQEVSVIMERLQAVLPLLTASEEEEIGEVTGTVAAAVARGGEISALHISYSAADALARTAAGEAGPDIGREAPEENSGTNAAGDVGEEQAEETGTEGSALVESSSQEPGSEDTGWSGVIGIENTEIEDTEEVPIDISGIDLAEGSPETEQASVFHSTAEERGSATQETGSVAFAQENRNSEQEISVGAGIGMQKEEADAELEGTGFGRRLKNRIFAVAGNQTVADTGSEEAGPQKRDEPVADSTATGNLTAGSGTLQTDAGSVVTASTKEMPDLRGKYRRTVSVEEASVQIPAAESGSEGTPVGGSVSGTAQAAGTAGVERTDDTAVQQSTDSQSVHFEHVSEDSSLGRWMEHARQSMLKRSDVEVPVSGGIPAKKKEQADSAAASVQDSGESRPAREVREQSSVPQRSAADVTAMWSVRSSGEGSFGPEERELFSYFLQVPGMEDQIRRVLEDVIRYKGSNVTSLRGNFIVQGESGSGKTVLATSLIRVIQRMTGTEDAKIGKINAAALNRRDFAALIPKLAGGYLIVDNAGDLTLDTVLRMSQLMESNTQGLVVVLEDNSAGIRKVLKLDFSFSKKFTGKVVIPIFTIDELVEFGKAYAKEMECVIDEMAVLALYNRISAIQKLDEPTTLTEVKTIVDEAIESAEGGGLRKLFSKRYNDNDCLILHEKDFEQE